MSDFGFQWHLTDRCNQRCSHCYQDRFDGASERPLAELCAMADRIFAAVPERPVQINLTGGEPLLLPHLAELCEHLDRYPNLEELNLITNGTLAPPELLARLAGLRSLRWMKVSVESGDPAVNDAVRGRGHLARVSQTLPRLREGAQRPVVLMVTLARYNVASVAATVDWARAQGVAGIIFERFVPLGQSRAEAAQVLGPREWSGATQAILQAAGFDDVDPADLLPFKAFWYSLEEAAQDEPLEGALCNLGEGSMALMPDGTVYPCRRLPIPLGKVQDTPFEVLLARLAEHAPDAARPRLRGPLCGACAVEGCAGCRALAYALHGDLSADDPQCPLQGREGEG